MATTEKNITIDWLGIYALDEIPEVSKERATIYGVYIIEKEEEPIYVGESHQEAKGIKGRFKPYLEILKKMAVNISLYKARIGEIKAAFRVRQDRIQKAERIIVRTFMNSKDTDPHRFPNSLRNIGKERDPLTKGKFQLTLLSSASPPAIPTYLTERLDYLSSHPRFSSVISGDSSIANTYNIETTSTQEYESFADSLTLRELRELEWV